ncbi:hypothetical protein MPTK1_7g15190 [Marchantia polymorpha subsp. ruderalis]|uniref:Uncharacterized protein n=2 Tax=Marchantia polymorpha TaxID=3197 RepID=A0AAF6BZT3_MARPO|nr:hypothetical protein MARPO_0009s0203 [Marchantia polymorpha]BBN17517.1 hypothetical protein Mp_7g15190 [Marchantia polymorpha subsp. ruderalis]|eukprot:PTQ47123.1 hypothetical protein MARPO_0009s0203 [Marchantia polymorpha]
MSKDLLPSPGTMEAGDGLNDQPRAQSEAEFGVRVDSRANPATDCLHHGPASKVTNPARQPAMFGAFGGDVYSRRHLIRRSSVHDYSIRHRSDMRALNAMPVVLAAYFFLLRLLLRSTNVIICMHGFFLLIVFCWSGYATDLVHCVTRTCRAARASLRAGLDESYDFESGFQKQ